jgi:Flp pilus assembly protein TadG
MTALPGFAARARLWREGSGVTAVEFAMLLPFFVILVFGIVQFGQVLFLQAALQHAVTAAARCASNFTTANSLGSGGSVPDCSTSSHVQTLATQQAFGITIASSVFTVCLNQSSCAYANTSPAQSLPGTSNYNCVTAGYNFAIGVPFLPQQNLTITASSCYPLEG